MMFSMPGRSISKRSWLSFCFSPLLFDTPNLAGRKERKGREGKGREGKGREGKGREGKGREERKGRKERKERRKGRNCRT